jgi:adenylate cyclase
VVADHAPVALTIGIVAARLESHTKVAERPILIDENTRSGLGDGIAVEPRGEVLMKGKTKPINVYAVLVASP